MGGGGLKGIAKTWTSVATLGLADAAGLNPFTEGPKSPASAKKLAGKAAKKTEKERLSRAAAKSEKGKTRYASENKFGSSPSMGMNLKKKMGA